MDAKTYPTTLGLFIEWFLGWTSQHDNLKQEDITKEMIDYALGDSVYGCFMDDENAWDEFWGTPRGTFGNDSAKVAKFISSNFNARIYVQERPDKFDNNVTFIVDGVRFYFPCCGDYGVYEYDVDEYGRRKN